MDEEELLVAALLRTDELLDKLDVVNGAICEFVDDEGKYVDDAEFAILLLT